MTERLYDLDPYLKEFEARVLKTTPRGVVLDRTAFYPAGGGQPCDLGTLNGVEVTDVAVEGGEVVHATAGPVEGEVRGVIDWERRRDHMQQHHGQHLLSEAFLQVAGAQTTSFHLGRLSCAIDLDRALPPIDVERAETLANMVVTDNRAVQAGWYSPDEAKTLPLRKPPPADEARIRIVTVRDFDVQACCGTHPRSSGEVGVVCVGGHERTKEGMRVHFVCGFRALREARENARLVRVLGQKLSSGRDGLEAGLDRAVADASAARKALQAAERELAGYRGRELAARPSPVAELFEGRDLEFVRAVANEVVKAPGKIVALASSSGASGLVLARSADVALDLRPIFKEAVVLIQGKGGGPPNFVQGGGPGPDAKGALSRAEELLKSALKK